MDSQRFGFVHLDPILNKFEALKFLGIGMGGILLALQALASHKRAKAMEDTAKTQTNAILTTEKGQQQERLKNAIEHLGHESDSVRWVALMNFSIWRKISKICVKRSSIYYALIFAGLLEKTSIWKNTNQNHRKRFKVC